jgi:hypothetical protein
VSLGKCKDNIKVSTKIRCLRENIKIMFPKTNIKIMFLQANVIGRDWSI